MSEKVFEPIVLFLGALWLIYKWNKTRSLRPLFSAAILLAFVLSRWPLFLPTQFSLSFMALSAICFLFYESGQKNKKSPSLTYFYVLLFVIFGIAFFMEGIFKLHR